jgi:hypothetical protein
VYSGITGIEGTIYDAEKNVPGLSKLIKGGSLVALEKGKIIFFITKGDGGLTLLIPLKTPENIGVDVTDIVAWFKKEFADWSPEWEEVFTTDALSIVARPWYYYPVDQHWKALPNLTMIGDAAHLMPPNGEGANQALADALELSEALCSKEFDTIEQAIASFEQKMRERCVPVHYDTLQLLDSMHAENNQAFFMGIWDNRHEAKEA